MNPRLVALVALGGALGAGARYLAFDLWPVAPGTFPTTTMCVNVVGALCVGIVAGHMHAWWARPLLGVGVLGGFTTLSTFAVEVTQLARHNHWALAGSYVFASVALGTSAAWAGLTVGRP